MQNILPFFVFTFSISLWLSFLILKFGKNWLIDIPDERKIHTVPIPRTGGIVLGVSFFISILFFSYNTELLWYLCGFLILFILGIIDDYNTVSWKIKLPVQLVVS